MAHEPGGLAQQPRHRVHRAHLQGGPVVELGQQAGQPLGEHGLARPRRTLEQDVVGPGGGDLDRALGELLAGDVGEIRPRAGLVGSTRRRVGRRRPAVGEPAHEFAEIVRHPHVDAGHESGLRAIGRRDHDAPDPLLARDRDRGQHTAHRAQPAVEAELGQPHHVRDGRRRHRLAGGEHRDRDRQVEARPDLAHVGGQQRDGQPPVRPLGPAVEQRRPDPVAGLDARRCRRAR